MKKILFSLMALVCSMSMNAQVIKVMKGNVVVATYTADQADNVVFEETPPLGKTGTEKRTGGIDVNWVQLWENGPRFAEYNVGAASASEYGGYYSWGGYTNKNRNDNNTGADALAGESDTATKLWGSNWRMPTQSEYAALLANCDVVWTNVNGLNGRKFTGRGDYASNSVFLPAAGYSTNVVRNAGSNGNYWSSTPYSDDQGEALQLRFTSSDVNASYDYFRTNCCSVRAVLAED